MSLPSSRAGCPALTRAQGEGAASQPQPAPASPAGSGTGRAGEGQGELMEHTADGACCSQGEGALNSNLKQGTAQGSGAEGADGHWLLGQLWLSHLSSQAVPVSVSTRRLLVLKPCPSPKLRDF